MVVPQVVDDGGLAVMDQEVDRLVATDPPPAAHVGHHFYWRDPAGSPGLFEVLDGDAGVLAVAGQLARGGRLEVAFDQAQVALNIPTFSHRPGRPHLDGYADGRAIPGTFTMLAAVLLTDELDDDSGNLWAWPGTHLVHARYFADRGPGAFNDDGGYPEVELPEPAQVHGRRGDLLLAHYLLGHNIGGNVADRTRRVVYWRLRAPGGSAGDAGGTASWEDRLTDPWCELRG